MKITVKHCEECKGKGWIKSGHPLWLSECKRCKGTGHIVEGGKRNEV